MVCRSETRSAVPPVADPSVIGHAEMEVDELGMEEGTTEG